MYIPWLESGFIGERCMDYTCIFIARPDQLNFCREIVSPSSGRYADDRASAQHVEEQSHNPAKFWIELFTVNNDGKFGLVMIRWH